MEGDGLRRWLLKIEELHCSFHHQNKVVKAVNGLSLEIFPQETLGIVGESGSGKSVTALSILNLLPKPNGRITSGRILFNSPRYGELDLANSSTKLIRNIRGREIGMVFQEPMTSFNPVMSCGRQVLEALQLDHQLDYKNLKEKTLQIFRTVELGDPEQIYDAYPHQLSGGQKQRVMIAMAISRGPALLLADEPTTALDVTVQAHILALLRDLKNKQGMAMMFITHDLGVIAEVADRVAVMYQGQMVEVGTVWDVFSNPQHAYTKGLLACRPRMDVKLHTLPTVADFLDTTISESSHIANTKYTSVGAALLDNFVSEEEVQKERKFIFSQPPLLQVQCLKTFHHASRNLLQGSRKVVKAIDNVSFEVFPGETLGLVGESGCGKTTLGRSIARLLKPSSGEIIFNGINISRLSESSMLPIRKDIQIIFQDPYASLNPRMTVGEALMEPMQTHGCLADNMARKKKILELLHRVGMKEDSFYRYPHEFSGGQRQRICIARAIALSPKFIICDESVSALDVSVQSQVLNLLNQLKREFHFTCLFISHNLAVVKFMADRIMVMKDGKIVELAFAEEIYASPENEYTRNLIAAIPKGDLEDIRKAQLMRGVVLKP